MRSFIAQTAGPVEGAEAIKSEQRCAFVEPCPRRLRGNKCMKDYDAWKLELQRAIAHLLEISFQSPKVRVAPSPKVFSFHQALARLYQEGQLSQFLTLNAWQQAGLSPGAAEALQVFKDLLDAYDEPDTDAEILVDPAWHPILQQGFQVLDMLK